MSIHVALDHVTHYRYDRMVQLGAQSVRLRPAPQCRTRILNYAMRIQPGNHFINWQQDPSGNHLAHLVFPERTQDFRVEVSLVAEMATLNPFDFFLEGDAQTFPFRYSTTQRDELAPCLAVPAPGPRVKAWLDGVSREPSGTVDFLVGLNRRLCSEVAYLVRLEPGVQTPEETLERGAGSCRDSAWLLVHLLRHLGLAARFVSGYLIQLVADVVPVEGPAGPREDFTDLHAWCEVFLPGAGWIGLDPTSGLLAGEGHLPLACAPDPGSASPVSGTLEPCEAEFIHEMKVTRIRETSRVTKPYTEAQWARIDALGQAVDDALAGQDVRLTQGGEPTFVAVDDPDGEEWNTAALGPGKRARGSQLLAKLRDHYAPGGLVHQGQGKWYPGEPLPRWSLNLFWRDDGEALWGDDSLLCLDDAPHGATVDTAARFIRALAQRLGVDPGLVFPAYEDVWYALWRERRLPVNVDPFDSRLDDPVERARLARIFSHGLGEAVGYVLPLKHTQGQWHSGSWFLREEPCLLLPGDSPMGLRLPLDSLPWVAVGEDTPDVGPDPASPRSALPPRSAVSVHAAPIRQQLREAAPPAPFTSATGLTRTALCVEPRGGCLFVFLPPLVELEAFIALIACLEDAARETGCPIAIEGYEPPRDPRLCQLRITPDPGVLEVNVQPVSRWADLVEQTGFLYESARSCGLSSEKFMLDGRHQGTGGGNHFVLGGATPADSPFLRRPDLLASMVGYWHQHPALSYLFSGLFIGPTSQAPRADEARPDVAHDLEIAFQELARLQPAPDVPVAPWLVDRLLRNLLVDVTGNTHRAEFCIDKLFTPDGVSGRLGLLELRAFEMPPHPRMSLVQQLLMRALVARFWRSPFKPARLQRWGRQLHDRFMLPHYLWADFADVLEDLTGHGFNFDPAWFFPHFEFRFPRLGDFAAGGVELELRAALEPWQVLGEEQAQGGTSRYVDSSLERLQVKVRGLIDSRHVVACNGRALPLQATDVAGEFVAGVRYRAWQPSSCLHPTIGVHTPLDFTLVDTWSARALASCQYHVMHPGGRNYATRPVNANEAEARRLARFFRHGRAAGTGTTAPPVWQADAPCTLDLRRAD